MILLVYKESFLNLEESNGPLPSFATFFVVGIQRSILGGRA